MVPLSSFLFLDFEEDTKILTSPCFEVGFRAPLLHETAASNLSLRIPIHKNGAMSGKDGPRSIPNSRSNASFTLLDATPMGDWCRTSHDS